MLLASENYINILVVFIISILIVVIVGMIIYYWDRIKNCCCRNNRVQPESLHERVEVISLT
jgi:hypothetical protein